MRHFNITVPKGNKRGITDLDCKCPLVTEFQWRFDVRHVGLNGLHDQSERGFHNVWRTEVAHFQEQGTLGGLECLEHGSYLLEEGLQHEHVVDRLLRVLERRLLRNNDELRLC